MTGTGGVSLDFGGNGGAGGNGGGGGGGGAGLGGAIFIQDGTTFNFGDNVVFTGPNTVSFGTGGTGVNIGGQDGVARGPVIFLQSGGTLNYNTSGSIVTVNNLDGGGTSLGGGIILPNTNTGTLILTGTSTYTGTTAVNGGTLEGSSSSIISDISTTAPGNVTFNQTSPGTYIHGISGAGSVTLIGTSTLTFNGSHSYSGTTSITQGTLLAGSSNTFSQNSSHDVSAGATLDSNSTTQMIAGLTGAGNVTLGTGGQLTVNNATTDDTYSGAMSGPNGTFIKSGSATLTISGTINLSGASQINVQSGQLNVNDSVTAGALSVAGGAILGGIGTVNAPISVSGAISPGTSIGTLTVTSTVTFMGSSALNIEVSPIANDQLLITGAGISDITLATLNILPQSGTYTIGTTYTIVEETGGGSITGPFLAVTNSMPRLSFQVLYSPTSLSSTLIQLIINGVPFESIVTMGNAGVTAAAFETLNPNDPDVAFLTNFLDHATAAQLQCDFDQMQLAMFNAIPIIQETTTTALRSIFSDRLREIHGTSCERKLLLTNGCGLWVAPLGSFSKQMNRSQHGVCNQTKIGFHSDTYGTIVGIDGEVMESTFRDVVLGGTLAYTHTNLHWERSQAESEADSGYASFYGTIFDDDYYLDLVMMGAFVSFDAKRNIFLENMTSQLKRTAKHTNHAGEFDAHVGAGITYNLECMQFRPYVNIDYLYIRESGYQESGASSIDLIVRNKYSNLLREEAGFSFSSWQDKEAYAWSQEIKLSYVHEDRIKGKDTRLHFVNSTDQFEVKGFLPDRNLFSPGFSINFYLPKINFSITGNYSGEFGKQWWTQTGSLKFLWRF